MLEWIEGTYDDLETILPPENSTKDDLHIDEPVVKSEPEELDIDLQSVPAFSYPYQPSPDPAFWQAEPLLSSSHSELTAKPHPHTPLPHMPSQCLPIQHMPPPHMP